MHIVDRRLNPHRKSLENRQRFLRRAKAQVQKAVRDASANRDMSEALDGAEVSIPGDGVKEPRFHTKAGDVRDYVLPGNRRFNEGDVLPRSSADPSGRGAGDGDSEDEFRFVLSREEFLDLFLDDLELPDLAKRRLAEATFEGVRRAGFQRTGSPTNMSIGRTMKLAMVRRTALRRPSRGTLAALEQELAECEDEARRAELKAEIEVLSARMRRIPYVDPIDVRYRRYEPEPKPIARAVMFCLMDVSGSMSEHMKDLAKRFYLLLYVFLTRRYRQVEIVFIRHTDRAEEVDEETFFRSPASGGTLVSSALAAMVRIVGERYAPSEWNIYAVQASDGDNSHTDGRLTAQILTQSVLPICQYFAYLEVSDSSEAKAGMPDSPLWTLYEDLHADGAALSIRRVGDRTEIFPVFRELFQRRSLQGRRAVSGTRLFEDADWNFGTLQRIHDACERIAIGEFGLDVYPNQIEVITAEQMLDAYSSMGMPLFYKHWSFGKHFAHHEMLYQRGLTALAYEIVINSSPCISYLMEENTAVMQTLVIAHAAFGHNHFFKNNYLFRTWTKADTILDYLDFAKRYIARCEDQHGQAAVARTLDAAHALMPQGVHHFKGPRAYDLAQEEQRQINRRAYQERIFNDLWRTVPGARKKSSPTADDQRRRLLGLPQENLLYFLEKFAPRLAPWQREVLRIVRHVAQYFYPQMQTKVMNEGCATYVHYRIMTRLHEQGAISDGNYLEFLRAHTNVVTQPAYDDPRFSGFNPYALGFAMMRDIERAATTPDDEDREWLPDIAGSGDAMGALREIWANYRDESFISQYLSPRLMRRMRLFQLRDDDAVREGVRVEAIHNERGYRRIRRELGRQYDVSANTPTIEVVDVDLAGDRRLKLRHNVVKGELLEPNDARRVLQHLADLWGYEVMLEEADASPKTLAQYSANPRKPWLAAA